MSMLVLGQGIRTQSSCEKLGSLLLVSAGLAWGLCVRVRIVHACSAGGWWAWVSGRVAGGGLDGVGARY